LVIGDPGIGKTAFLRRSADLLRGLGLNVLQGSGEESESDVPFAMLTELMGQEAPVPPAP
jgi:predicted ATP-dependent serine protease